MVTNVTKRTPCVKHANCPRRRGERLSLGRGQPALILLDHAPEIHDLLEAIANCGWVSTSAVRAATNPLLQTPAGFRSGGGFALRTRLYAYKAVDRRVLPPSAIRCQRSAFDVTGFVQAPAERDREFGEHRWTPRRH